MSFGQIKHHNPLFALPYRNYSVEDFPILRDFYLVRLKSLFTQAGFQLLKEIVLTPKTENLAVTGPFADLVNDTLNLVILYFEKDGRMFSIHYTNVAHSTNHEYQVNSNDYLTIGGILETKAINSVPSGIPVFSIARVSSLPLNVNTGLNKTDIEEILHPFFHHHQLQYQVLISNRSIVRIGSAILGRYLIGLAYQSRLRPILENEVTDHESNTRYYDGIDQAAQLIMTSIKSLS